MVITFIFIFYSAFVFHHPIAFPSTPTVFLLCYCFSHHWLETELIHFYEDQLEQLELTIKNLTQQNQQLKKDLKRCVDEVIHPSIHPSILSEWVILLTHSSSLYLLCFSILTYYLQEKRASAIRENICKWLESLPVPNREEPNNQPRSVITLIWMLWELLRLLIPITIHIKNRNTHNHNNRMPRKIKRGKNCEGEELSSSVK